MNIHFIAIGGSAMHNLAIALHKKGHRITGSDDAVFEPSRSRLANYGLLPEKFGWHPEKINTSMDAIILGMHAKPDNPELLRAKELEVPIYSYPEYLFHQAKDKKRIVIAGSHGKTSITAMILHVLKKSSIDFDYMVGAQLEGFDTMVKLSDAPIIVLEGDEYLSSPIDRRSKFLWYKPHIAVISGIAWDHINVFPTFEEYVQQFEKFVQSMKKNGKLIYFKRDEHLKKIVQKQKDIEYYPYDTYPHEIKNGVTRLISNGKNYPIEVFGDHNLQNLQAAMFVCLQLGIDEKKFLSAIQTFKGAARRLEKIGETDDSVIYKDFAHSPSKLTATIDAVRKQFPTHTLLACMELHTFSSLTKDFLKEYNESMNAADIAYVYFNPETIERKGLAKVTKEEIKIAFRREDLIVLNDSNRVKEELLKYPLKNTIILLMTSGNFDGIPLNEFAEELIS